MRPEQGPKTVPHLLLAILSLSVVATLLYGGFTSEEDYGAYNSNWEGTAQLRSLAESEASETLVVRDTSTYETVERNGTVSFLLSPEESYSDREMERIERFVRGGGTLVLAEDYRDRSNRVLEGIGAEARFSGAPLRDERAYEHSPDMPQARPVSETGDTGELTLNHGTVVVPNGATALANTSSFAYLDANWNDRLDPGETLREYPVVVREQLGDGEVVAVGDASVFINAMLEHTGNEAFVLDLVGGHRTVLFDVSHAGGLPPLVTARLRIKGSPLVQMTLGVAIVLVVSYGRLGFGVLERLRNRRDETAAPVVVDDQALEAWVRERHPEWDPARVRRVTEEVTRRREED